MRPLPTPIGYGITSNQPITLDEIHGYRYESVGRYHNYHATPQGWKWPVRYQKGQQVIDGCSPNLNKNLHAGHLKNLAVAAALSNLLGSAVAMLGRSLGELPQALAEFQAWCQLAQYRPTLYFDTDLPKPSVPLLPGSGNYKGCQLYQGVVIYKSNGQPTYAAHDLAFAEVVKPDYYLTGAEQKEHFNSLGLGNKHISLGLLLGPDGKKMRSTLKQEGEEANALSAQELLNLVIAELHPTPQPRELAWNILAWQFNSSNVTSSTKFNAELWTKPESPGLYITYTYARIQKALDQPTTPPPKESNLSQDEVNLLHLADQTQYYLQLAQKTHAPCLVAQCALQIAKTLSHLYKVKPIAKGSPASTFAFAYANEQLGICMDTLGMHRLPEV